MTVILNRLALAGVMTLGFLSTANAHMSLETGEAAAGSSYKAVLRVPHGCDGAATSSVSVKVPEGFFSVKPMPHAGWELSTVSGPYEKTYMNHGSPVTDGVQEVTWSGGMLPDAHYDEFVMRGSLATDLPAGSVLSFPAVQTCVDGSEIHWAGHGGEPAPTLKIAAAMNEGEHHHGQADMAAPAAVSLGDLEITGAFARATLPGAPVGGGFLTITNNGDQDDLLLSAASGVAGMVQLHNMRMEGDVMKMYQMRDGIPVPAHETVRLQPGGLHVMFMQLNGPLVEGSVVDVELTFEKAGKVTVPLHVEGIAAKSMDHAGHGDMNHGDMKAQ